MRKSLLVPALSLALLGPARAQTAVTLYGIADGDLRVDHTSVGTLKSLGSGGQSASRWGLRGSEDLGDGFKAIFDFEQDFDLGDNSAPQGDIAHPFYTNAATSSGSRLFGRRAVVALRSDFFGEVRIGREYTPFYEAWLDADPFGAGTVSRATNYAVGNTTRFDNALTYESPRVAGLGLQLQYRPGESVLRGADFPSNLGDGYGASLTYASGPWYVAAAYLSQRDGAIVARSETVAVVYDFRVAKLHALGFHTDNLGGARAQSYAVGVTVPLHAFKLLAAAARVRIDDLHVPLPGGSQMRRSGASVFGGGVIYTLSKRTDLYAAAAKAVNGSDVALVLGDMSNNGLSTPANQPPGFHPWSAQVGIRHLF